MTVPRIPDLGDLITALTNLDKIGNPVTDIPPMSNLQTAYSIAEEYVNTNKIGRAHLRDQYAADDELWSQVQRHVAGLITRPLTTARPSTDF